MENEKDLGVIKTVSVVEFIPEGKKYHLSF
jgi:hypothetical protein